MVYINSIVNHPESDLTLANMNLKKDRRNFICDHYVMVLLCKGKGVYVDEETGCSYPLEEGDVFQRFPRRSHAHILEGTYNEQFFLRVPKALYFLMQERGQINSNPVLKLKSHDIFEKYQQCLLDCERENDGSYALWRIKDLIVDLHKLSLGEAAELPLMDQIVGFLEKNVHRRIPLTEVADLFNMSYISFRRNFKESFGISPGSWQISKRVEVAKQMFENEVLSMETISAYLGYPDIYTFSKQFKKVTGRSPADYRHSF